MCNSDLRPEREDGGAEACGQAGDGTVGVSHPSRLPPWSHWVTSFILLEVLWTQTLTATVQWPRRAPRSCCGPRLAGSHWVLGFPKSPQHRWLEGARLNFGDTSFQPQHIQAHQNRLHSMSPNEFPQRGHSFSKHVPRASWVPTPLLGPTRGPRI